MDLKWFERLVDAINADGRDLKTLSLKARCGPNYVQQMIREGKRPGVDRFVRLLSVLGREKALYIIMGQHMTPEGEEILRLSSQLAPEVQKGALQFLRTLPKPANDPEPAADRQA